MGKLEIITWIAKFCMNLSILCIGGMGIFGMLENLFKYSKKNAKETATWFGLWFIVTLSAIYLIW